MHPRFKLDWLYESNTDEKSLKGAITIKLQNQMTLTVPGSMSTETRIPPDDPKKSCFWPDFDPKVGKILIKGKIISEKNLQNF